MKILRSLRNLSLLGSLAVFASAAFAQVAISVTIAPPELPIYEQPECPDAGYIWTPGYWAWAGDGYYWVPGVWVLAPDPGLYWTPGYWGWTDSRYIWYPGYWGPEVGFYGGVDYGYGYYGDGYYGGRWDGDRFRYNTAFSNVNPIVVNNYIYVDRTVIVNNRTVQMSDNQGQYGQFRGYNAGRVSFNGGRRGVQARPTQAQVTALSRRRMGPVAAQQRLVSLARQVPQNFAKANHGEPPHAALQRPATNVAEIRNARPARAAAPGSVTNRGARPTPATRPGNAQPAPAVRNENRPATRPSPDERRTNPGRPTPRTENRTPAYANPRPEYNSAPTPEARPTPRIEARPQPRPEAGPQPRPEAYPAPRPETGPTPRPEAQPAPRPEARPQPRPEARPEPRPEARPQSRPEARPEPRPEARPQARPEARPEPRQESRPEPKQPEPQHKENQPQG